MLRRLFPPLAGAVAVAIVLTAGPVLAQEPGAPAGMERMHNWAADREALLNAKLAGLKAGLNLTAEQEKNWAPFENAAREAAKLQMQHMMARMERMHAMMEGMRGNPGAQMPSPIDRLDTWALILAEDAAAIKNVADAARPLYGSLDENQKRIFGWLGRELLMMGHGHHGMGMMRRHMGMMEGDHDEMGMGPQGRDHMDMMGHGAMGPMMHDGADEGGNSGDE